MNSIFSKTLKHATIKCNYGIFHDDITNLKVDVLGETTIWVTGYAKHSKTEVCMSVDNPNVWHPNGPGTIEHLKPFVEAEKANS